MSSTKARACSEHERGEPEEGAVAPEPDEGAAALLLTVLGGSS